MTLSSYIEKKMVDFDSKTFSSCNFCGGYSQKSEIKSFLRTALQGLAKEMVGLLPQDKDISLNEVGTVGDYHTHGFNECHDKTLSNIKNYMDDV